MRLLVAAALLLCASSPAFAQRSTAAIAATQQASSILGKDKERRATQPSVDLMIGSLSERGRILSAAQGGPPGMAAQMGAAGNSDEDVEERLRGRGRSQSGIASRLGPRAVAGALCQEAAFQGSEALLRDAELTGLCGAGSFRLGSSKLP